MQDSELKEIRLYGHLGARFGRIHRLAVSSTSEAIRALSVLQPGFAAYLRESDRQGISYACFLGKENIGAESLRNPIGTDAIRIAPVIQGAKRGGLFQTVLGGALLIGATIMAPGVGAGAAFAAGGYYGAAAAIGGAFFLGGISQMLAPQQKGLSTKDATDNGSSYNFNGPVNTTAQGKAIPILYGRMIIGSAVLSAGYFSEDVPS